MEGCGLRQPLYILGTVFSARGDVKRQDVAGEGRAFLAERVVDGSGRREGRMPL